MYPKGEINLGKNNMLMDLEKENVSLRRTLKYISHELLNVLTLVDYSVKAVDGSVDDVKDNKYWNYIVDDVEYMVKILKELSNYNHCSELCKERCSVSKWMYYIANEMKEKYKDVVNIITCIEGDEKLFEAEIDRSKIRQVVVNLIKNAVEAMDGKEDGLILICLKREKEWISIDILDNGCGINSENQERVFEEGISINKKDGSGLGLAISKKIIESHNGMITVKSSVGKGTIFNIKLPVN